MNTITYHCKLESNDAWYCTERCFDSLFEYCCDFIPELQQYHQNARPECSVVFVSDKEIASLNIDYRKTEEPTDVLSFPDDSSDNFLGDIILAPRYIFSDDKKRGCFSCERCALSVRFVHAVLHLCGYDHLHTAGWEQEEGSLRGKEMASLTDEVLTAFTCSGCQE